MALPGEVHRCLHPQPMGTQEEEQSLLKDDEFQFGQVEHPLCLIHSYWDASFSWCLFSTVKANPNYTRTCTLLSKQFLSHHVVGQHSMSLLYQYLFHVPSFLPMTIYWSSMLVTQRSFVPSLSLLSLLHSRVNPLPFAPDRTSFSVDYPTTD